MNDTPDLPKNGDGPSLSWILEQTRRDAQVIAYLTTQLDAYKLIAARLAGCLDRVHYELPTGQDWSISQVLAAYEELNDC